MNNTSPPRIAIIGGGITGLSAAFRLTELTAPVRRAEITLFEAAARFGGGVGTRRIGDYLVETGADSFITNKPGAIKLCERLDIADQLMPTDPRYRGALVLKEGRPVEVPPGFQLLSPTKIWPVLRSPIFTWRGKLRMMKEFLVPRRKEQGDESLGSFIERRFGKETLDRLVQPLVGGIYTADPYRLSLQATMPRFLEMEQQSRSLIKAMRKNQKRAEDSAGARYGLFAAPKAGMQQILDTLENRLRSRVTLRPNTTIKSLRPASQGYEITTAQGETLNFAAVLVALPAFVAANLISDWDAELAASLNRIPYASSAILSSGHLLSDFQHPMNSFGLVIPARERRQIIAASFASRKFPGRAPDGRIIVRTFLGGAMQEEVLENSDAQLEQIALQELSAIFGMRGQPDFMQLTRYTKAMPQYHVGHCELVHQIEQQAARHPGFRLAGNAYHGVGIPDSIQSGEDAAEQLLKSLSVKSVL